MSRHRASTSTDAVTAAMCSGLSYGLPVPYCGRNPHGCAFHYPSEYVGFHVKPGRHMSDREHDSYSLAGPGRVSYRWVGEGSTRWGQFRKGAKHHNGRDSHGQYRLSALSL